MKLEDLPRPPEGWTMKEFKAAAEAEIQAAIKDWARICFEVGIPDSPPDGWDDEEDE